MMEALSAFLAQYGDILAEATRDSLVMTVCSCAFAYVVGLPLGIWLAVTTPTGLAPNKAVNAILGWVVNVGRSIPFIILLVAIIPFTRLVVGTSLGVTGAIVPLTVAAAPFVARVVEQSLAEVDASLIEAAQSFGASRLQIVAKVLLVEALPSLVRGAAITFVSLFGYAAMAGTVGAGGLGDVAIRYGYQRFRPDVMLAAVILCVVFVQVFQSLGDWAARRVDKRRH